MRLLKLVEDSTLVQSSSIRRIGFAVLMAIVGFNLCGCAKNSERNFGQDSTIRQAAKSMLPDVDVDVTITIWHDSFDAAQQASLKSGKPILACFTGSDWCHWCVKLKDDVFEKDEFERWASNNVVLLELDYPRKSMQSAKIRKQNDALKSRYSISGFPTVLVLNGDGAVLAKMGYGKDPVEWIKNVEAQMQPQEPTDFVGH